MKPQVGDWIEVRSKEEILATLDRNGTLDELPFMPQMFQYCGQKFQVYKRAHKTCDTVSGVYVGRRMPDAVHLEHRCDGQAYGGCQAECLIFWKEAWLKPVGRDASADVSHDPGASSEKPRDFGCTVDDVWKGTHEKNGQDGEKIKFTCQATQLLNYTAPLKWWDPRQYIEDYRSGNAPLAQIFNSFLFFGFTILARNDRWGRPARWLYDRFQTLRGGTPYPRRKGTLPPDQPFPVASLDLQPGDVVRVKSYEQILATVDQKLSNLGLNWGEELVPYCGRTYRVRSRVEKFIDERSGILKKLKTPAVILEGVTCQSRFSDKRIGCPRAIFAWWREVWLERVSDAKNPDGSEAG